MVNKGIMVNKGNHPQMAARFRLLKYYYNLPIYIYINLKIDMNSSCTTWKYEVNIIYTILETQLSIFLGVTVYIYICWVPNVCW